MAQQSNYAQKLLELKIENCGKLAANVLATLWGFELDLRAITTQEEIQKYKTLIGEIDIFLEDLFESKNSNLQISLRNESLAQQIVPMEVSSSDSDDDMHSDDFEEVRDLRK